MNVYTFTLLAQLLLVWHFYAFTRRTRFFYATPTLCTSQLYDIRDGGMAYTDWRWRPPLACRAGHRRHRKSVGRCGGLWHTPVTTSADSAVLRLDSRLSIFWQNIIIKFSLFFVNYYCLEFTVYSKCTSGSGARCMVGRACRITTPSSYCVTPKQTSTKYGCRWCARYTVPHR